MRGAANEDGVQFLSLVSEVRFTARDLLDVRSVTALRTAVTEVGPAGVETQDNQARHHSEVPVLPLWISDILDKS